MCPAEVEVRKVQGRSSRMIIDFLVKGI